MVLSTLKPEDVVRQNFVAHLITLGFPPSHLVQERALDQLPHLKLGPSCPLRRVDLLAYGLIGYELKPLLLVECKAKKFTQKAFHQLLGYNHFVEAPFIALVSSQGYALYNCKTQNWERALDSYTAMCAQA